MSLSKYAELVSLSRPKLSRIIAGSFTKPLPAELIEKFLIIGESEVNVTSDELYSANGMVSKERKNKIEMEMQERFSVLEQAQFLRNSLREFIRNKFIHSNIPIRMLEHRTVGTHTDNTFGLYHRSDFTLEVYGLTTDPPFYWSFCIQVFPLSSNRPAHLDVRRFMERFSGIFLIDAWSPEAFRNERTTFVFSDKERYQLVCDYLKAAPFNSQMSALWVNLDTGEMDETLFECKKSVNRNRLSEFDNQILGEVEINDVFDEE